MTVDAERAPRLNCSGLLGRTSLRPPQPADIRYFPFALFRPSRPDFIETLHLNSLYGKFAGLFRPSRPDFIETSAMFHGTRSITMYCSGLLGRTSLRHAPLYVPALEVPLLFRPSRPDFIETRVTWGTLHDDSGRDCSGLLGRTSLRLLTRNPETELLGLIVPAF